MRFIPFFPCIFEIFPTILFATIFVVYGSRIN